jgi:hypothetical protein
MIIDYTMKALDGVNVVEAKTTLENAKKLIAVLPSYCVEDALKALFGEEETEVAE